MTNAAIILCAGYATRMSPLTDNFPKPLLEVAGKPVLNYLIDQLSEFKELDEIHIVTNDKYYKHFLEWSKKQEMEIQIHNDGTKSNDDRLGAIGDLDNIMKKLNPDKALVTAADNIFRFKLSLLWNQMLHTDNHFILGLPENDLKKLQRTGVLELDGDRVLRLMEKPLEPPSNWSCPAIYFFQGRFKKHLLNYV